MDFSDAYQQEVTTAYIKAIDGLLNCSFPIVRMRLYDAALAFGRSPLTQCEEYEAAIAEFCSAREQFKDAEHSFTLAGLDPEACTFPADRRHHKQLAKIAREGDGNAVTNFVGKHFLVEIATDLKTSLHATNAFDEKAALAEFELAAVHLSHALIRLGEMGRSQRESELWLRHRSWVEGGKLKQLTAAILQTARDCDVEKCRAAFTS